MITRFGYLGLGYRTDMLSSDDVKSYKVLWDNKVKGKVGFFDWYLPSMGCISLYDGNKPPFDISDAAFGKLKQSVFSLKPQSAGFYPMAAVFSNLTNGTAAVIPGVGDWITLLLSQEWRSRRCDGPIGGRHPMDKSLSICASSPKKDLGKGVHPIHEFARGSGSHGTTACLLGVHSQQSGLGAAQRRIPRRCKTLRHTFTARNVMDEYKEGKIFIRKTPVKQSIETWNEAWTEFKSAVTVGSDEHRREPMFSDLHSCDEVRLDPQANEPGESE